MTLVGQADTIFRLHLNLIEHVNSEIGLGTITNIESAKTWLSGTFMFVRLKANPSHYHLDGDTGSDSFEDRLERICLQALELLSNHDLIAESSTIKATAFGEAMARYYVSFESMKLLMSLPTGAKISEIVSDSLRNARVILIMPSFHLCVKLRNFERLNSDRTRSPPTRKSTNHHASVFLSRSILQCLLKRSP